MHTTCMHLGIRSYKGTRVRVLKENATHLARSTRLQSKNSKASSCISMIQTIKAYKCMKTTLKAYKSNMGTKHKSYISKGTKYKVF